MGETLLRLENLSIDYKVKRRIPFCREKCEF